MKTLITARHCKIDDALRERTMELLERISKLAPRCHRAEVIFDDDHNQKVVEFQLYLPRSQTHVAKAEAADFRTALDRAATKIRNQFDKVTVS